MESPQRPQSALFEVYLRLRPPPPAGQLFSSSTKSDRFLTVEEAEVDELPSHITLNPPNDNRRRAVEKFAFTKVFEEHSTQLDILQGTGVLPLVEGVLGPHGGEGRDGLLATLGVTGSGKVSFNRYEKFMRANGIVTHHSRISYTTWTDPARPRCSLPIHLYQYPRSFYESLSSCHYCGRRPIRIAGHVCLHVPRNYVWRRFSPDSSSIQSSNSNGGTIIF